MILNSCTCSEKPWKNVFFYNIPSGKGNILVIWFHITEMGCLVCLFRAVGWGANLKWRLSMRVDFLKVSKQNNNRIRIIISHNLFLSSYPTVRNSIPGVTRRVIAYPVVLSTVQYMAIPPQRHFKSPDHWQICRSLRL